MNENDNIIVLNDEDGNEVEFEFADSVEYNGNDYVVLFPCDEDDDEVVILKVEGETDDDASYVSVDDEEELTAVFEIFKENNKDNYNFAE